MGQKLIPLTKWTGGVVLIKPDLVNMVEHIADGCSKVWVDKEPIKVRENAMDIAKLLEAHNEGS